jgi:hypothetical protein
MPSNDESRTKVTTDQQQETGPWDAALDQVREWDPKWAELGAPTVQCPTPGSAGCHSEKNFEL